MDFDSLQFSVIIILSIFMSIRAFFVGPVVPLSISVGKLANLLGSIKYQFILTLNLSVDDGSPLIFIFFFVLFFWAVVGPTAASQSKFFFF